MSEDRQDVPVAGATDATRDGGATRDAARAAGHADVARASATQAKAHSDRAGEAASSASESAGQAEAAAALAATKAAQRPLPLLVTGALVLVCLIIAAAVAYHLVGATGDEARTQITVLVVFIGMAFACLGFGLFLVGATGAFKGSTSGASGISVETAAPGLVVMVCATLVIYFGLDILKPPAPPPAAEPAAHTTTDAGVDGALPRDAAPEAAVDAPSVQ